MMVVLYAMMIVLYKLVLFALSALIVYLFCTRLASRQLTRALGVIGMGVIALALIFPNATSAVAAVFGIGRGADFLFYLAHLFALFAVLVLYVRLQAADRKLTRIVRELALREAETKPPKS